MFGLNPVATGMLIGSIVPGMGTVIGGAVGAMYDQAQGVKRDAQRALDQQYKQSARNQNALVESQYNNIKQARGMADTLKNPDAPGMSGATLNSITGNDELVNILG